MSIRQFIKENRQEIDAAIHRRIPGLKLNDTDRYEWILSDEGLYRWARSAGCCI